MTSKVKIKAALRKNQIRVGGQTNAPLSARPLMQASGGSVVWGECVEMSDLAGAPGCILRIHTEHNWPRHRRAQYAQYVPGTVSPDAVAQASMSCQ
jgi:hypothetical protein